GSSEGYLIAGPLIHSLVGLEEFVAPEILPEIRVRSDRRGRTGELEAIGDDVGGHVAGVVEELLRLETARVEDCRKGSPLLAVEAPQLHLVAAPDRVLR